MTTHDRLVLIEYTHRIMGITLQILWEIPPLWNLEIMYSTKSFCRKKILSKALCGVWWPLREKWFSVYVIRKSCDWRGRVEQFLKITYSFLDCGYNNSKRNCDKFYCFPQNSKMNLNSFEIYCQVWWYFENLHFW